MALDLVVGGPFAAPENAIDAQLTGDGPGAEDGSLHLTGMWLNPDATTLYIQGTLGGRTVSVSVPATQEEKLETRLARQTGPSSATTVATRLERPDGIDVDEVAHLEVHAALLQQP